MINKNNKLIVVPTEGIISKIFIIRGKKVMIDRDIAQMYGVKPIRLREQVKRNKKRFPKDFMFRLTEREANILLSQIAIPSRKQLGGSMPYVFTEQGVAMLSGILNSDRAVYVNIQIMRSFIKLREMLSTNVKLKIKIEEMEKKYDKQFLIVFEAIKQLIGDEEEKKEKKQIGYKIN